MVILRCAESPQPEPVGRYLPIWSSRESLFWSSAIPVSIETTDLVELHTFQGTWSVTGSSAPPATRQLFRKICTDARRCVLAEAIASRTGAGSSFTWFGEAEANLFPLPGNEHSLLGPLSAPSDGWVAVAGMPVRAVTAISATAMVTRDRRPNRCIVALHSTRAVLPSSKAVARFYRVVK